MDIKSHAETMFDTFFVIIAFLIFGLTGIFNFNMLYNISMIFGFFLIFRYMIIIIDSSKKVTGLLYAGIILTYLIFCFISRQWYSVVLWVTIISVIKSSFKYRRILNCLKFLVPTITYIVMTYFFDIDNSIQNILLNILFINLIMIFYFIIIYYYKKYIAYKEKNNRILYKFALNELVGKNLNKELAIKNQLIERNTRLEESETISRKIHNCVGHSITASIMALEAAEVLCDVSPQQAKEKVEVANSRMHESLNGIRQAVRALDDETNSLLLSQFLKILTQSIEKFSLDANVRIRHNLNFDNINCDFEIDRKHIEFLKSAMLEAFSNGVRHGNSTAFIVMIKFDLTHLQLTIEDNGTQFSKLSKQQQNEKLQNGFGLKKIKSYLDNCGGELKLSYEDGFSTIIVIPLIDIKEDL